MQEGGFHSNQGLLLLLLSVGCGGSSGTSDTDQPEAAQTEQMEGNAEDVDATGDVDTEGLGDLLSSTYVEMMKNNEYMRTDSFMKSTWPAEAI